MTFQVLNTSSSSSTSDSDLGNSSQTQQYQQGNCLTTPKQHFENNNLEQQFQTQHQLNLQKHHLTSPLKPGKSSGPVRDRLMDNKFLCSLSSTLENKLLAGPETPETRLKKELLLRKKDLKKSLEQSTRTPATTPDLSLDESATDPDFDKQENVEDLCLKSLKKHQPYHQPIYIFDEYSSDEDKSYKKSTKSKSLTQEINSVQLKKTQNVKKIDPINENTNMGIEIADKMTTPDTNPVLQDSFSSMHKPFSSFTHPPQPHNPNSSMPRSVNASGDPDAVDISYSSTYSKSHPFPQDKDTASAHSETLTESSDHSESYEEPFSTNTIESFSSPSSSIEPNDPNLFSLYQPKTLTFPTVSNAHDSFSLSLMPQNHSSLKMMPPNVLDNLPLHPPIDFDLSLDFLSSSADPLTLSYLVQSAIGSTSGSKILSDTEFQNAQSELALLKSRKLDIEHKILMEKKIQESAKKLAESGIGKWSNWNKAEKENTCNEKFHETLIESPNSKNFIHSTDNSQPRPRPLSTHALEEVSLSTHNITLLQSQHEKTIARIEHLSKLVQSHTAAILALTHPGSGTKYSWQNQYLQQQENIAGFEHGLSAWAYPKFGEPDLDNSSTKQGLQSNVSSNRDLENVDHFSKEKEIKPLSFGKTNNDGGTAKIEKMKKDLGSILNMIYTNSPDIRAEQIKNRNANANENKAKECDEVDDLQAAVSMLLQKYKDISEKEGYAQTLDSKSMDSKSLVSKSLNSELGSNKTLIAESLPSSSSTSISTEVSTLDNSRDLHEPRVSESIGNENKTEDTDRSDSNETESSLNQQIALLQNQVTKLKLENSQLQASYLAQANRSSASVMLLRHQFSNAVSKIKKGNNNNNNINDSSNRMSNWDQAYSQDFDNTVKEVIRSKDHFI